MDIKNVWKIVNKLIQQKTPAFIKPVSFAVVMEPSYI